MRLSLTSSGGLGGFGFNGEIDTADLPAELARRVEEHLTSKKLRSISAARSSPVPDAMEYQLAIMPEKEDGEIEHHVVDDMCPVGEVLDVIDDLMAEIARRRRAAGSE